MPIENDASATGAATTDTALTTGTEAAAVTTPAASADGAAAAIEAKPASIDDTLRAAWDKLHPSRDDGGRFARRDGATEQTTEPAEGAAPAEAGKTATESTGQPEAPDAGTAKPSTDAPQAWPGEAKAKWASVPPDLQAVIAKREAEAHQAITRAGEEIRTFAPIREVIDRHAETFQRNNLPPHEGIARMLAVEQWLGQDPAAAITELAKAYGVDLAGLTKQPAASTDATAQQANDGQSPAVQAVQRELAATQDQLRKVVSHLSAQQRREVEAEKAQTQAAEAALKRQIAEFAQGPNRVHFDAVRRHMAGLLQSGAAETLEQAYDMATHADPEIRKALAAEQRKADEEKRAEEARKKAADAKKSAGVNVRSTSAGGNSPKTMEDTLREVARRHYA